MVTYDFNIPKRTHRITIQSLKGRVRHSKSFSIYAVDYEDDFLFTEIDKVLSDGKLNRPMYFETKNSSHVVLLVRLEDNKCLSKCFKLHQSTLC